MIKEIEVKFFVDDLAPVRRRLKKLGAKFEGAYPEHDFMFDNRRGDLKRRRETLRIRKGGTLSFLTYKTGVKAERGFKVADEHQIEISDALALKKIFEHLGFKAVFEYKKPRREYWKYMGEHVTLDSFPFGKFAEVEGTKKRIRQIAGKLGLEFSRSSAKSYRRLLEEYRKSGKVIL
ncbi:MAG: class IV adenylate cyclase [Patescibacteria group bacterium]